MLFVMSEPAFMLAVTAWLALGLRWPLWYTRPLQALAMGALAVAAWSIRGAGITCVAATILYPMATWVYDGFFAEPRVRHCVKRRSAALLLVFLLPLIYQVVITRLSPEKSLASAEESANSYPRQLLSGLTNGHRLSLGKAADFPAVGANVARMVLQHLNDFAGSFVPWERENPDMHFRDLAGKLFAVLGLLGWAYQAWRGVGAIRLLNVFVLFYIGLYLVWPFDFARFWSPLLPIMLACGADGVIRFMEGGRLVWGEGGRVPRGAVAGTLLGLLLVLSAEEVTLQLGNYAAAQLCL